MKSAEYTPALFVLAEQLFDACRTGSVQDPFFCKVRVLVGAVRDYHGHPEAAAAVAEGGEFFGPQADSLYAPAPEVRREQLRLAAYYARLHDYRKHSYMTAAARIDDCRRKAEALRSGQLPLFGLRAELEFFAGCARRQLREYAAARTHYDAAIDLSRQRAAFRSQWDPSAAEREYRLATHRTALVMGLGLGWVAYSSGQLNDALNHFVAPSLVVLMGMRDPIHQAYLRLVRGAILRSRAGSGDGGRLEEAIEEVGAAWVLMKEGAYEHRAYSARAAFELALCYLAKHRRLRRESGAKGRTLGDLHLRQAEDYISEMESRADHRWQSNVAVLRSRVARSRQRLADALAFAETANSLAQSDEDPLGPVDALIAWGEALSARGDHATARQKFEAALRLVEAAGDNPKVSAVLLTHLARTAVGAKNLTLAQSRADRARSLGGIVEHAFAKELLADLDKEIDALKQDFVISWTTAATFDEYYDKLRCWLIGRAITCGHTRPKAMATFIGVSEVTVRSWLSSDWWKKAVSDADSAPGSIPRR